MTIAEEKQEKEEQKLRPAKHKGEKKAKKKITLPLGEYHHLKQKAEERDAHFDRLLRLQAEFENTKKRLEKERTEFLKYAHQGVIIELLNIVDNFERAEDAARKGEDYKLLHQGVEMILKELHQLLKNKGVAKMECLGAPFDPERHEAIMHMPSEEHPENTIVEEVRKGYMIDGRVIRPAIVKVAKKPEETKQ